MKSFLGLLGLFILIYLFLFPYQKLSFTENEGIYGSIAQEMRNGAQLYRDVWDHKPPLIYLEYEAVQNTLGISERALHVFVVICHWLCAVLLLVLLKRLGFGTREAWAAALFYAMLVAPPWFQGWTGQADLTMQVWLLASFIFVLSPKPWACYLSGLFWGLAFFTKQTALIYLPIYFFMGSKPWLEILVEFILGADTIAAVIAVPFYFSNRMHEFWGAIWGFNVGYIVNSWRVSVNSDWYLPAVMKWLAWVSLAFVPWLVAVGVALRRGVAEWKTSLVRKPNFFLSLWFGLAVLGCGLSGRFTNYYFIALLAPLAAIGGALLFEARSKGWGFAVVLAICPLLWGYASGWRWNADDRQTAWYQEGRLDAAKVVGLEIKRLAKPGDKLLAWTTEPEIYVYSGLPMALVKTPLVNHLAEMPDYLASLEGKIASENIRFVVLSSSTQVFGAPVWLTDLLAKDYRPVFSVEPFQLYMLKGFSAQN